MNGGAGNGSLDAPATMVVHSPSRNQFRAVGSGVATTSTVSPDMARNEPRNVS